MKNKRTLPTWLRSCLLLLMMLCILNASVMPVLTIQNEVVSGTVQSQAATIYKKFIFTKGLNIFPGNIYSYAWEKMKKNDIISISAKSTGPATIGICRLSDRKMFAVTRSGNFTTSIRVPSDGYYRVFILNESSRFINVSGSVSCIH